MIQNFITCGEVQPTMIISYSLRNTNIDYLQVFLVVDQRETHPLHGDDDISVNKFSLADGVDSASHDRVFREQNHTLQTVQERHPVYVFYLVDPKGKW